MDDIKPTPKKTTDSEEFVEPAFVEPEELAAKDDTPPKQLEKSKKPKKGFISNFKSWPKKKKLIALTVLAGILIGTGLGLYLFVFKSDPPPPPVVQEQPAPEPEPPKSSTEASRLSGVQISPELNKRGITAIMIENSVEARPQSGLHQAGVVFEAIAEGGITRFVALFQENQPDYIGPVRSARPYYIEWMSGFDATYVHAGGSAEALSMISSLGIKTINHGANGDAFQRINYRYSPHNLYTSTAKLDAVRDSKGYSTSNFTSLVRKTEAAISAPNAAKIDLNVSSANYKVHYDYDAGTNSYKRSMGGKPHTDEKSGTQLNPKVVVAWVIPYKIHPDGVHSQYTTSGNGKAIIFQDGTATEVTWSKKDRLSQITFTDAAGVSVGLNPGQTWFTALADAGRITYSP